MRSRNGMRPNLYPNTWLLMGGLADWGLLLITLCDKRGNDRVQRGNENCRVARKWVLRVRGSPRTKKVRL